MHPCYNIHNILSLAISLVGMWHGSKLSWHKRNDQWWMDIGWCLMMSLHLFFLFLSDISSVHIVHLGFSSQEFSFVPGKAPQSLSSPGQQKRGHPLDNLGVIRRMKWWMLIFSLSWGILETMRRMSKWFLVTMRISRKKTEWWQVGEWIKWRKKHRSGMAGWGYFLQKRSRRPWQLW